MATVYLSRPVFQWDLDWSRRPTRRIEFGIRELAFGLKEPLLWSDQEHVVNAWNAEVLLESAAEIEAFDRFTEDIQGRLVGFWLPAPEVAFRVASGIDELTFDIEAAGLVDSFTGSPELHLHFSQPGEEALLGRVQAVTAAGPGLERVTMSGSLGKVIDSTWTVRPLLYVRMADDIERAEFLAENRQVRQIRVVELPSEYAAAETGQTPVFFYRFWMDTDPVTEWRFTSFSWDLEINEDTWIAKRIAHGAITRTTRADQPEFTVHAERDPDIPLFDMGASGHPLNVEIREGTYAQLSVGEVIAIGRVQSVKALGRELVARCGIFYDALPRSVPGFLLQPRCNWQVYSEPCGVPKADFAKEVTVQSVAGRDVVIEGAALIGLPAGWFAEGWIQVGAGREREIRTILSSSAEATGQITLTLSLAFRRNHVGESAEVVPGCDGRFATCNTKFSNLINWGGHRSVRRNLTLKAVEIAEAGAGKK